MEETYRGKRSKMVYVHKEGRRRKPQRGYQKLETDPVRASFSRGLE